MKNKKGLFLDRDGVLNKLFKNRPPWNMDEIEIYDESKEIIQIAKKNGYIPIVVTNQPDAARGCRTKNYLQDKRIYMQKIIYREILYLPTWL